MIKVRIVKNWTHPNLLRQTPGTSGFWEDVEFSEAGEGPFDFVVVLNSVPEQTIVHVPRTRIWHVTQEPPVDETAYSRPASTLFYRRFTPDITQRGSRVTHTHTALPWHVNRTYDDLKHLNPPDKLKTISCITSNLTYLPGHRLRLAFLEFLNNQLEFDLWGRGFSLIDDKWDGLAPYKYSLAIENYSGPHYWTEKLADCFLSWTMPIYYGCTNIFDYFPEESIIRIDISRPAEAVDTIKAAVSTDLFLKHREAIAHARELVLEKYQFFPFIAYHIRQTDIDVANAPVQRIALEPSYPSNTATPPAAWSRRALKRVKQKLLRLVQSQDT